MRMTDEEKETAKFAGAMVAGMACLYLFVKLMSLAAYLDNNL